MLRAGAIILSTLNGVYMLLAASYLTLLIGFNWIAPSYADGLYEAILSLKASCQPDIWGMGVGMAKVGFICAIGYFLLIILTIWKGLMKREKWAFWTIAIMVGSVQIMMFTLYPVSIVDNVLVGAMVLCGIALSACGLFRPQKDVAA